MSTTTNDARYDLAIVGGGLAGVCAALAAIENGARTVILEKADTLGGSWNLSGGALWTARDHELYCQVEPNGDPVLGKVLTEGYLPAMTWLEDHGVKLEPLESPILDFGHSRRLKSTPAEMIEELAQRFAAAGGTILRGATVQRLERDGAAVVGVAVKHGGRVRTIPARAVLLCSGGFGANTQLLTRYVGRWADRLLQRCHPGNNGSGFLMGLEIGAAASRALQNIYGHMVPAAPAKVDPPMYREVTFYGSIHTIVLNLHGERFCDESVYDATTNQELAYEPEARGFMVFDATTEQHEREIAGTAKPGAPLRERLEIARKLGGDVIVTDSLDVLAETLGTWGGHAPGVRKTIAEYNAAAAAGTAAQLRIPRRRYAHPIAKAPFYAISVRATVTFTEGGLKANGLCEVLDRNGDPIPGLYAAGADAGGIFYERYAGGGAWSVVSGLAAARNAVARNAVAGVRS